MTISVPSPQTSISMVALHVAEYCMLSLLPMIDSKLREAGSKYLIQTSVNVILFGSHLTAASCPVSFQKRALTMSACYKNGCKAILKCNEKYLSFLQMPVSHQPEKLRYFLTYLTCLSVCKLDILCSRSIIGMQVLMMTQIHDGDIP